MAPFELIEHTADIGIRVHGESMGDLFCDAAIGMFSIISEEQPEGWPATHRVELKSPDAESLLIDWLAELLYLFEVKNFFTVDPVIETIGAGFLKADVRGVRLKGIMNGTEIKAVTYHLVEIERKSEGGFETTVYFDL